VQYNSSLIWDDYNEVIKSYRGNDRPSAYAVLVNACLSQVGEWATAPGYKEYINYVFEEKLDDEGWIKRNYLDADKDPRTVEAFRFRTLTYVRKRDLVQVQAADVNAWESCRNMKDNVVSKEQKVTRPELISLKGKSGSVRTKYFEREELRLYIAEIEANDKA